MKKKRKSTKRRAAPRRSSSYSSRVDGHPLFTIIFVLLGIVIVSFAVLVLVMHKASERVDDANIIQVAQPTPTATRSY